MFFVLRVSDHREWLLNLDIPKNIHSKLENLKEQSSEDSSWLKVVSVSGSSFNIEPLIVLF